MRLNEDPAVETIWWLMDIGGVRLWGEGGPSRWVHGAGSADTVVSWWEYIQRCLAARVAGCVGQPPAERHYVR